MFCSYSLPYALRAFCFFTVGGMAEWSMAAVLKTVSPKGDVGSNPTPSAMHHGGCMAGHESYVVHGSPELHVVQGCHKD